jgi:choline kinase
MAIEKISAKTGPFLFAELAKMVENYAILQDYCKADYARLVAQGVVFRALDITGLNWTEIDTPEDFAAANAKFETPVMTISRGQQKAIDEAPKNAVKLM